MLLCMGVLIAIKGAPCYAIWRFDMDMAVNVIGDRTLTGDCNPDIPLTDTEPWAILGPGFPSNWCGREIISEYCVQNQEMQ